MERYTEKSNRYTRILKTNTEHRKISNTNSWIRKICFS